MAIEPIKGFYVHDEVSNTDGVAKYDYEALENTPNFGRIGDSVLQSQSIGVAFLETNNGVDVSDSYHGGVHSSTKLDAMNSVVAIPSDAVSITLKCPVFENPTTFGVAFYSDDSLNAFVEGYAFNDAGEYGSEWRTFYIPKDAHYWRTSWFHDTQTYGAWEGYFNCGSVPHLADDVESLNAEVFEELERVPIVELEGVAVTAGYAVAWSEAYEDYTSYYFKTEPFAQYIIKGENCQLIRAGNFMCDFDTEKAIIEGEGRSAFSLASDRRVQSENLRYVKYTNDQDYGARPFVYFMGKTPNFPNATFEVYKFPNVSEVKEKTEVPSNAEVELVDTDSMYFGGHNWNKYITNCNGHFSLKYVQNAGDNSNVNFSLSDIRANTSSWGGNMSNAINNQPAIGKIGKNEVIEVNVDVTIRNTTFTQFAVAMRKPNTGTTMQSFFNIKAEDTNEGNFVFSKEFYFPEGTELGVIFLYFEDAGVEEFFAAGKISVVKKKKILDKIERNGSTFYLDNVSDVNLSRGYAKANGKLHKNGKYIVNSDNVPVELRGYGLHGLLQYNNLHGRKPLESLRNYGVNMIRISAYLEDYVFNDSDGEIAYGYLSHPDETKAEIDRIIKNCIDLGLYVLLDWHVFSYQDGIVNHAAYTGTDVLHETEAVEFFTYYTQKYGDCPNMLWEIANEPHNLTPAQLAPFVSNIRDIIIENVTDPVMVCGYGKSENGDDAYSRCKRLYDELADNYNITDVFISPHSYPPVTSFLNSMKAMYNADFPVFSTEWGNSSSSGSGGSNDTQTMAFLDWMHEVGLPQAVWKFTDQTYLCSVLVNQGIINSEKWLDGFSPTDISQNGSVVLGRWADYVRGRWIERTAIS